jgi:sec-independent protein translocase protein TatB
MFDLGLGIGEIIVLIVLALIVVGPQELPNLFYKIGQFVGRLKAIASEFQHNMEDIAHEQEIEKIKKLMNNPTSFPDNTTDTGSNIKHD